MNKVTSDQIFEKCHKIYEEQDEEKDKEKSEKPEETEECNKLKECQYQEAFFATNYLTLM